MELGTLKKEALCAMFPRFELAWTNPPYSFSFPVYFIQSSVRLINFYIGGMPFYPLCFGFKLVVCLLEDS